MKKRLLHPRFILSCLAFSAAALLSSSELSADVSRSAQVSSSAGLCKKFVKTIAWPVATPKRAGLTLTSPVWAPAWASFWLIRNSLRSFGDLLRNRQLNTAAKLFFVHLPSSAVVTIASVSYYSTGELILWSYQPLPYIHDSTQGSRPLLLSTLRAAHQNLQRTPQDQYYPVRSFDELPPEAQDAIWEHVQEAYPQLQREEIEDLTGQELLERQLEIGEASAYGDEPGIRVTP